MSFKDPLGGGVTLIHINVVGHLVTATKTITKKSKPGRMFSLSGPHIQLSASGRTSDLQRMVLSWCETTLHIHLTLLCKAQIHTV